MPFYPLWSKKKDDWDHITPGGNLFSCLTVLLQKKPPPGPTRIPLLQLLPFVSSPPAHALVRSPTPFPDAHPLGSRRLGLSPLSSFSSPHKRSSGQAERRGDELGCWHTDTTRYQSLTLQALHHFEKFQLSSCQYFLTWRPFKISSQGANLKEKIKTLLLGTFCHHLHSNWLIHRG